MHWSGNYETLQLRITKKMAHSCDFGLSDPPIEEIMASPQIARQLIKLEPEDVKKHLRETGAWKDKDLKNHYTNLKRILWLAFTDIVAEEEEKHLLKRIQNF